MIGLLYIIDYNWYYVIYCAISSTKAFLNTFFLGISFLFAVTRLILPVGFFTLPSGLLSETPRLTPTWYEGKSSKGITVEDTGTKTVKKSYQIRMEIKIPI